jgi:primary-amine oxidase
MKRLSASWVLLAIPLLLCSCTVSKPQDAAAATALPYPLDPLTSSEIEIAAKALRTYPEFPAGAMFSTIVLNEPAKSDVLKFKPGDSFSRQAFSVILDRKGNRTFEALVDIKAANVTAWNEVKGVQPLILEGEYELASNIVKADVRWQEAMRKRGIDDFRKVQVEAWAPGQVSAKYTKTRVLRGISFLKGDSINYYGRPIEGVDALVDMNKEQVVEFTDSGAIPLAPPGTELDRRSIGLREAPRPLNLSQPDGPSFKIEGHEVSWQKWRFRFSMHPREGLVLHNVGYEDSGRVRSILYRASLSEIVVPYGDTDPTWRWRSAFDIGEYSVGRYASSLQPGTDVPDYATLLNATFADDEGKPTTVERIVGIYERDGGFLWRHFDYDSLSNQSRRARELVISFMVTQGNYDYAINWIFHQDGMLEVDVALTGIMLSKGVKESAAAGRAASAAGHLVAPYVVAPHHQHFFSFRLDFDVDGENNSVGEMNTRALAPGPDNPSQNGMMMEQTVFKTEREAQRQMNMDSARSWVVLNPSVHNALGQNSAYIIAPGTNAAPYVLPSSDVRRRAGFINNHFWATRYNPSEMYAAGAYPNQSQGGDGLPRFIGDNEPLENQDVVVWYTLGLTHIPRPEEWPVMSATHIGFKLIPGGFFSRNPALDVP